MNLNKIKIVLGREFSIRVKKKSFIIMTLIVPLVFAAMMVIPSLIMLKGSGKEGQKVLIVDQSGIVAHTLKDTKEIDYVVSEDMDIEALKVGFDSLGVYALVHISPLDQDNNITVMSYSSKQLNMDVSGTISRAAERALEDYKLGTYDIENLEEIIEDIKTDVQIETYTIKEGGKETKSIIGINMAISYVMSFFIYIFVFMFGNMVLRSVIDEKSSRIVEVIVSSVKPFDLMIGKIFGVASVALLQFLIWIGLTLVLVVGVQAVVGTDELIAQMSGTEQMAMIPGADAAMEELTSVTTGNSQMAEIMTAISEIDFVYILTCFIIYFMLAYLLYAAMFAAIGSAVDNEADTQQLMLPVTMPMIIGLFIMIHTFQHPDSSLSFWASMIPFTSPMVMLARVPFEGGVPMWELLLSIAILFVTFLLITFLSAKIYRVGILMYGKKGDWKDLWKWIKY